MIVRNVTVEDIMGAAQDAGVSIRNLRPHGRGFRFTLGLVGERFRRLGLRRNKVNAVC